MSRGRGQPQKGPPSSFKDGLPARVAALKSLQQWVFEELKIAEHVPEVIDKISRCALVQPGAIQRDGVAEVVNALVTAAAIESRSYDSLLLVVEGLVARAAPNNLWGQLGFRICEASLCHFPLQTLYFLLCLIERGIVDIYVIFKYLKNNGVFFPELIAIYYYFSPELRALKPEWFATTWAVLHSPPPPNSAYSPDILGVIAPSFATELSAIDWGDHIARRASGHGLSPLIASIRDDDSSALLPLIANANLSDPIPFDLYEQFVPWTTGPKCEGPSVLELVGLFGAANCFSAIRAQNPPDWVKLATSSAAMIVAGGNIELVRALIGDHVPLDGALWGAIRSHNHQLFRWLRDAQKVQGDDHLIPNAVTYANFAVFQELVDQMKEFYDLKHGETIDSEGTILHYIARANAVEMFKYAVVKANGSVGAYEQGRDGMTFLHVGARYAGFDVVRNWCRWKGNDGLDAIDENSMNPYHYTFLFGTWPKPQNKDDEDYRVRRPNYFYLKRRSIETYDVAKDKTPEI
jgi:hypothetical protein